MKATIHLSKAELRSAVCRYVREVYGVEVKNIFDIEFVERPIPYHGDPRFEPVRTETELGVDIKDVEFKLGKEK